METTCSLSWKYSQVLGICHFDFRKNIPVTYYVFTYQEQKTEIALLLKCISLKMNGNWNSEFVRAQSLDEMEVTLWKQLLVGFLIFTIFLVL